MNLTKSNATVLFLGAQEIEPTLDALDTLESLDLDSCNAVIFVPAGDLATVALRDLLRARNCTSPVLTLAVPSLPETASPDLESSIRAQKLRELGSDLVVCGSATEVEALQARLPDAVVVQSNRLSEYLAQPSPQPAHDNSAGQSGKPRLALVTPWIPQMTGIARHAVIMHRALSAHYEVVVVSGPDADRLPGVDFLTPEEFPARAVEFDRVLYQMGNSPFHEFILPFLSSVPGVVVMHDGQFTQWFTPTRGKNSGEFRGLCYSEGGLRGWRDALMTGKELVRPALGFIMHSHNGARKLVDGPSAFPPDFVHVAPLVDMSSEHVSRSSARSDLELDDDEVVVATFGRTDQSKRTVEFLETAVEAALTRDAGRTRIAIVGAHADAEYAERVMRLAAQLESANVTISVTGELDDGTYARWVAAADIAVQLRSVDRGESSAALVEAMKSDACVIVEDVGSMSEVLDGTGVVLASPFDQAELLTEIRRLMKDQATREDLAAASKALTEVRHNVDAVGSRYREIIEHHYERRGLSQFVDELASTAVSRAARLDGAARVARNRTDRRADRLVVDVSEIASDFAVSGIQRVQERVANGLIDAWPGRTIHSTTMPDCIVETIDVASRELTQPVKPPREIGRLEATLGDWLFSARYFPDAAEWMRHTDRWRADGGRVAHLVYDLFPVTNPEWFPEFSSQYFPVYLRTVLQSSDKVLTISKATLNQLVAFLNHGDHGITRPVDLAWIRLGSDFSAKTLTPRKPRPSNQAARVLMVGTIEPRKGYNDALDAFAKLWTEGSDIELHIVGRRGWGPQELLDRVADDADHFAHLTWHEDCADEQLADLYLTCDVLLAASHDEGFGLPLIEADGFGLPVLARDLEVFREVMGDAATYFPRESAPEDLAAAISHAIAFTSSTASAPTRASWSDTSREISDVLTGSRGHARWEPMKGVTWL